MDEAAGDVPIDTHQIYRNRHLVFFSDAFRSSLLGEVLHRAEEITITRRKGQVELGHTLEVKESKHKEDYNRKSPLFEFVLSAPFLVSLGDYRD